MISRDEARRRQSADSYCYDIPPGTLSAQQMRYYGIEAVAVVAQDKHDQLADSLAVLERAAVHVLLNRGETRDVLDKHIDALEDAMARINITSRTKV